MDKSILLKYLNGELDSVAQQEVLDWINATKENEQYFINLMNLWATQTVSQEKASEGEYAQMIQKIRQVESGLQNRKLQCEVEEPLWQNEQSKRSATNPHSAPAPSPNPVFKRLFWAAAAVIVLLVGSNLFLLSVKRDAVGIQNNIASALLPPKNIEAYKELYTNRGVKAKLLLPDSSVVYLNSDTKIIYPDRFDSLSRNVQIEGEAYFKVTRDTTRPMIVTTGKGFAVRVLGTEFNLKANRNDANAQATLYSGKIDIIREKAGKVVITDVQPNETITIGDDNICTKVILSEPQKLMAWRDGKLIFDNTPVSEAVKMLERWHGVEVDVADASILNFKLTATFEQESIVQILELLKIISYIDYSIEGKHVTLKRR
jgi:transmembrane sensor